MKSDHLRFLSHKIEVWARLTVSSRTTYQSRICETYVIYVYPVSRTTTVPTQFWLVDHYLSCSLSESGTMTFYCGLLPSSWISENKLKLESISCVTDSWNANILHLALQGVSVLWPPWLGVRSFPFKGGGIRLEMTAPAVIQWTGSVHISQEFPWLSCHLLHFLLLQLILSSPDERDAIQKKTFTKWVNKHLKKVRNLKICQFWWGDCISKGFSL